MKMVNNIEAVWTISVLLIVVLTIFCTGYYTGKNAEPEKTDDCNILCHGICVDPNSKLMCCNPITGMCYSDCQRRLNADLYNKFIGREKCINACMEKWRVV